MKQQSKIGELLRKNGVKFTNKNQRQKIIPLFIEDETRKYERKQIIKSHDYFHKQINHNYTEMYMSTLFGMLFMNEKQYYAKRNKLLKLNAHNNNNHKTITSLKKQHTNFKHEKTSNTIDLSLSTLKHNVVKQIPYYSPRPEKNKCKDYVEHAVSKSVSKVPKVFKQIELSQRKMFHMMYSTDKKVESYLHSKRDQSIRRYAYLTKYSHSNRNENDLLQDAYKSNYIYHNYCNTFSNTFDIGNNNNNNNTNDINKWTLTLNKMDSYRRKY